MRPFPHATLLLAATLAASHGLAAQAGSTALPDAKTLLATAREALGDTGPRVGVRFTGTVAASWVTSQRQTPFGKGTFSEVHGPGNRRVLRMELGEVGTYAWGSDGQKSWRREPVAGATWREGRDARIDTLLMHAFGGHLPLANFYMTHSVKKSQAGARPIYEIHARRDEPSADVWRLDAETGLPTGATLKTSDGLGQQRTWTVTLADWREHGGRRTPYARTFREGHVELQLRVTSVERIEPPKDAAFRLSTADAKSADTSAATAAEKLAAAPQPLIRVQRLPDQHALVIRAKVKPSELSITFARILPAVAAYLNQQGIQAAGAPFSIYHSFSPQSVEVEAGFPIAKKAPGKGEIKHVVLPAGDAVITWHVGPYHELSQSHRRLDAWMTANGWAPRGALREYYWTDPGLEPNPRKWRTEMIRPVQKRAARK